MKYENRGGKAASLSEAYNRLETQAARTKPERNEGTASRLSLRHYITLGKSPQGSWIFFIRRGKGILHTLNLR